MKKGHNPALDLPSGNKVVNNDPVKFFTNREPASFVPMGSS